MSSSHLLMLQSLRGDVRIPNVRDESIWKPVFYLYFKLCKVAFSDMWKNPIPYQQFVEFNSDLEAVTYNPSQNLFDAAKLWKAGERGGLNFGFRMPLMEKAKDRRRYSDGGPLEFQRG